MIDNYLSGLKIYFKKMVQLFIEFKKIVWLSSFLIKNGNYRKFKDLQVIGNFII